MLLFFQSKLHLQEECVVTVLPESSWCGIKDAELCVQSSWVTSKTRSWH